MPITSPVFHSDPDFPPPAHDPKEAQYLGFNRDWGLHFFTDRKTNQNFIVKPGGNVEARLQDIRKRFSK